MTLQSVAEMEIGELPTLPGDDVKTQSDHKLRRVKIRLGISFGFLVSLVIASLVAPLPFSTTVPDANFILSPPSLTHWFGTDESGLDIFSRTISAAHLDLLMAFSGALIGLLLGVTLGLVASRKTKVAYAIMRVVDVWQAFPLLLLILAVLTVTGGGVFVIILVVAIANTPIFVRVVRAEALTLRESNYFLYASIIGVSPWRETIRHGLRNVTGVIMVQLSLATAGAISVIAAISFLGQGVKPPTPSWGSMIQTGSADIGTGQWWPVVFPSVALALSIIALNVLADSLDSILSREAL